MNPVNPEDISPKSPISSVESRGIDVEQSHLEEFSISARGIRSPVPFKKLPEELKKEISDEAPEVSLKMLDFLEERAQGILSFAEGAAEADLLPLSEWAETNASHWVDLILAKDEAAGKFNQFFSNALSTLDTPISYLNNFVVSPLGNVAKIYDYQEIGKAISTHVGDLRMAYSFPATLGNAGILIYRIVIYKQIAKQLTKLKAQYKERPDPLLKAKIQEVQKWLRLRKPVLKEQSIGIGLKFAMFAPQFAKQGIRIATEVGHGLGAVAGWVGFGIGSVSGILAILSQGMQLSKAADDKKMQLKWMKTFQKAELSINRIGEEEVKKSEALVSTLLEKRKKAHEKRREALKKIIDELELESKSFEEGIEALKKAGISISAKSTITTQKQLLEAVEGLIEETIQHQNTLSQLARNGLKSQGLKKQRLEYRFSKFKLRASTVSLFLAIISTAVVTTLTVCILAGAFSVPPLGLALIGLGFALASMATILAGGLYFYSQKPTLTREWLKGVNQRLALYGIPASYRAFKLQIQKIKKVRNGYAAHEINAKMYEIKEALKLTQEVEFSRLPKALQLLVKKHKKEKLSPDEIESLHKKLKIESEKLQKKLEEHNKAKLKIDQRIAAAEKKLEYWRKKKEPLEKRLVQAGLRDFLKASHLDKDLEGNPIHLSQLLVEGILEGSPELDFETVQILTEKMGIDLQKIQNLPDKAEAKKTLGFLLEAHFAQRHEQVISFIRNQFSQDKASAR
ncbi:hypothetical protein [Parachlamydia sp. AcF125]|uniref:hypothetical protein n=1 Tax=Parachlamydia sp. AcF125 TaxID=2795736 RepID=UPI001BC945F1|nr:hypothetical protein [Parachlamydia sp. AcF125]MBS4167577.1 hypothetical protein [Parachlamydia sp. AcF125]